MRKIINRCAWFFILGCILRIMIGFSSYNCKINKISQEENKWYENLARCESIIIEKGDVECYDTFRHNIEKYEDAAIIKLRKQVLPSIIMANRYGYGKACKTVFYETNHYSLRLYHKSLVKDRYAFDWGEAFLKRGIALKDKNCLYDYSQLLETGYFSKEDSILGSKIYRLIDKNRDDSVTLWKEYRKLSDI